METGLVEVAGEVKISNSTTSVHEQPPFIISWGILRRFQISEEKFRFPLPFFFSISSVSLFDHWLDTNLWDTHYELPAHCANQTMCSIWVFQENCCRRIQLLWSMQVSISWESMFNLSTVRFPLQWSYFVILNLKLIIT